LTFRRIDDCKEAASVIKWAWEKDYARRCVMVERYLQLFLKGCFIRKGTKLGQSFKASNESLTGDSGKKNKDMCYLVINLCFSLEVSPRKQFTRAIAVKPYIPKKYVKLLLPTVHIVLFLTRLLKIWRTRVER